MPAVATVVVVGAGFAGTALGLRLAQAGIEVTVVERKPDVGALGSGITMQGNALRVLRDLGVWDEARAAGYPFDGLAFRLPDPAATLIGELEDQRTGGPDLPATLGISRPVLAEILLAHARRAGVTFEFGRALVAIEESGDTVTARFANGDALEADFLVGADGARSTVRSLIGIEESPQATGVGAWRMFLPRPASITRTEVIYGGPAFLAGFCPTGENSQYAYLLEAADAAYYELSPAEQVAHFRALASKYHGPWDDIVPLIDEDRPINYTTFEGHLVDGPWNRGRVMIIGDAAHTCPPTVAQGAAQSLEDAWVLAELLIERDALDASFFEEFTARRLPRAQEVVRSSLQITGWMVEPSPDADIPGTMGRVGHVVSQPV